MNIFIELSLIIVVATLVSFLMKLLRQPLIVGYIASGVIVGPYALNLLQARDEMELFGKIGIAILLFIVGLMLNPDVMREVGKTSVITGVGQVLFTSIVGFLITRALGFESLTASYIAIALTFSSTIIILKLLSDRGDTEKLYGKISIGFLLIQDIIAIILLLVISILGAANFSSASIASTSVVAELLSVFSKGILAIILLYFISRYVLPSISKFMAEYQEILFLFSLAWGLGISSLFFSLGFSIEIGALAAGITLAASPFAYEIASRMKPLRDFFIMLFFVLLGAQIVLSQISALIIPALVLSIFVLIGNPLIMIFIMNLMGYRNRTAFMTGLTVAQISEFSLILVALGFSFGHLNAEVISLVTLVGIITIACSTYLILYADPIYTKISHLFKFFTIRKTHRFEKPTEEHKTDIIIFGYDRVGYDFVKVAKEIGSKYMVVDFNPKSIARLVSSDIPYRYGDAEDVEFLQEIGLAQAKLVVSTIPDLRTNILLVNYYRTHNKTGIIISISHSVENTKELYDIGASYVVMPHHLGASQAASLIAHHRFNSEEFEKEKSIHLKSLAERKEDNVQ